MWSEVAERISTTSGRVFLWAGIKITKFPIFTKSEYANKRVLWLSAPLIEIPCYMLCFLSESSLFVVVGVGKFILFLALAKRGKGNALFVFLLVKALDEKQNVHFLCGGLTHLFFSHKGRM